MTVISPKYYITHNKETWIQKYGQCVHTAVFMYVWFCPQFLWLSEKRLFESSNMSEFWYKTIRHFP